jgi:inhibitor of growth protein 1
VANTAVAGKTKKKQQANKTKGRQSGGQTTQTVQDQVPGALPDDPIDPDEETYCLCGQVRESRKLRNSQFYQIPLFQISYGEMILCENDLCRIEWFHFSCVSLQSKPKGRWYCPNCRGDRPNVMNKKFLRKKFQDSPTTERKFV